MVSMVIHVYFSVMIFLNLEFFFAHSELYLHNGNITGKRKYRCQLYLTYLGIRLFYVIIEDK